MLYFIFVDTKLNVLKQLKTKKGLKFLQTREIFNFSYPSLSLLFLSREFLLKQTPKYFVSFLNPFFSLFISTLTPFHGALFITVMSSIFVSQNMRFRYHHALIVPFFSMNTQTLSNSTPFSNLKKPLSFLTHRFQPKRTIFTVFCSKKRNSKYPPLPLKTNGYHGASQAKVPKPGKFFPFFC